MQTISTRNKLKLLQHDAVDSFEAVVAEWESTFGVGSQKGLVSGGANGVDTEGLQFDGTVADGTTDGW
jgi:hypothetical protein